MAAWVFMEESDSAVALMKDSIKRSTDRLLDVCDRSKQVVRMKDVEDERSAAEGREIGRVGSAVILTSASRSAFGSLDGFYHAMSTSGGQEEERLSSRSDGCCSWRLNEV